MTQIKDWTGDYRSIYRTIGASNIPLSNGLINSERFVIFMGKAETIDRLELTRRKFAKQLGFDEATHEAPQQETQQEAPKEEHEEHYGISTCPNCDQMSLVHEGGCEHCLNCGWSACG